VEGGSTNLEGVLPGEALVAGTAGKGLDGHVDLLVPLQIMVPVEPLRTLVALERALLVWVVCLGVGVGHVEAAVGVVVHDLAHDVKGWSGLVKVGQHGSGQRAGVPIGAVQGAGRAPVLRLLMPVCHRRLVQPWAAEGRQPPVNIARRGWHGPRRRRVLGVGRIKRGLVRSGRRRRERVARGVVAKPLAGIGVIRWQNGGDRLSWVVAIGKVEGRRHVGE
jgi:hypothetical protein